MLTTITTTSQDLTEILSETQFKNAERTRQDRVQKILIQNLWASDIYVEFGTASAVGTWIKITTDASFAFEDVELSDCELIADTSENADVRIIIN